MYADTIYCHQRYGIVSVASLLTAPTAVFEGSFIYSTKLSCAIAAVSISVKLVYDPAGTDLLSQFQCRSPNIGEYYTG